YEHMTENDTHLQICPISQNGNWAALPEGVFSFSPEKLVALIRAGLFFSACGKLFRADIIKNRELSFPEGLHFGEDLVFCLSYYPFCEKLAFNSSPLYVYNRNDRGKSLSQKPRSDIYTCEKLLQKKIKAFAVNNNLYSDELGDILKARLFDCAYNAICLTGSQTHIGVYGKYIFIKKVLADRSLWQKPDPALAYSPHLVNAMFSGSALFLTLYINVFAKTKSRFLKERLK
ncbi:MAG TPA: hypothetical protein PKW24_04835, partial [Clostridiales bacterium]|nr:hypothetical protein [Clostridiales bacterium]